MPSQQRKTNSHSMLERKSKIEKKGKKKPVLVYFAFFIRYSLIILDFRQNVKKLYLELKFKKLSKLHQTSVSLKNDMGLKDSRMKCVS